MINNSSRETGQSQNKFYSLTISATGGAGVASAVVVVFGVRGALEAAGLVLVADFGAAVAPEGLAPGVAVLFATPKRGKTFINFVKIVG